MSTRYTIQLLAISLVAASITGCQSTGSDTHTTADNQQTSAVDPGHSTEAEPLARKYQDPLDFMDALLATPRCTVADAVRAVLLVQQADIEQGSFEDRRNRLSELGIVPSSWKLDPHAWIDRGLAAYMICRVMDIDGGVNMRLSGTFRPAAQRYANRELVYLGIMPQGADYLYISGPEFASLIGRVDRHIMQQQ